MSNSAFSKGGQTNFNNVSVEITGDAVKTITITQANGNIVNTTFSAGDPLPEGVEGDVLYVDGTGTWVASNLCTLVNACLGDLYTRVDNLEDTVSTQVNTSIPPVNYGYLYNWYAATDSRNISSLGWKTPSTVDIKLLYEYLGATVTYFAGSGTYLITDGVSLTSKLKDTNLSFWSSTQAGINETKFNARGSGYRDGISSIFSGLNSGFYGLLSNIRPATTQNYYFFISGNNSSSVNIIPSEYKNGMPIRLLKETTALLDGQSGTYIGNDGKVYRTICIGTQEWVADNLAETKYRDGSAIPVVADNSAWAALTTGARCAYNNYDPYV